MDRLNDFLMHLNGVYCNIQFMMELECREYLPLGDVLVIHRPDGSLGQGEYRMAIHTGLYLNANRCFPGQKLAMLSTLLHWARAISDANSP